MSRVSLLDLADSLASGPPPVCAVVGEEVALVDDALAQVRQAAAAAGFPPRQFVYVDGATEWSELCGHLSSGSLFGENNFLQIMLPAGLPAAVRSKAEKGIEQVLSAVCDEDLVLISAPPSKGRRAWLAAAEQRGAVVEIKKPTAQIQRQWLRQQLQRHGVQLSREQEALLGERTEGNLLAARMEIERLALLPEEDRADGGQTQQSAEDAGQLDVFQLANACLIGDAPRAMRALRLMQGNESDKAPLALAILGRYLSTACRLLYHQQRGMNLGQAMEQENVWSRDKKGFSSFMQRLPAPTIRALAGQMGELDRRIKGYGIGDPWQEIGRLALAFCGFFPFRRRRAAGR